MRFRRLFVVAAIAVLLATVFVSPASPAKPAGGSFTTTLTIGPTTFAIDGYTVTASGSVVADVTQFKLDSNGHVVAVATASGTVTLSEPTLGTATITFADVRLVLNARVQADCSGHLHIDFTGVLQIDATAVFTALDGTTTTVPIHETIPLHGSLDYNAATQQQQSLICDIATLLQNRSSANALLDKLNTLLKTL